MATYNPPKHIQEEFNYDNFIDNSIVSVGGGYQVAACGAIAYLICLT